MENLGFVIFHLFNVHQINLTMHFMFKLYIKMLLCFCKLYDIKNGIVISILSMFVAGNFNVIIKYGKTLLSLWGFSHMTWMYSWVWKFAFVIPTISNYLWPVGQDPSFLEAIVALEPSLFCIWRMFLHNSHLLVLFTCTVRLLYVYL